MNQLAFMAFSLNGVDAEKFLQGQVTVHVERLPENHSRYTAICDLKGRIHFGLWLKKISVQHFELVTTLDQAEEFSKHIKKFGAFSKMQLVQIGAVFPSMVENKTEFSFENELPSVFSFLESSIIIFSQTISVLYLFVQSCASQVLV